LSLVVVVLRARARLSLFAHTQPSVSLFSRYHFFALLIVAFLCFMWILASSLSRVLLLIIIVVVILVFCP
jgi:hypothetical protein